MSPVQTRAWGGVYMNIRPKTGRVDFSVDLRRKVDFEKWSVGKLRHGKNEKGERFIQFILSNGSGVGYLKLGKRKDKYLAGWMNLKTFFTNSGFELEKIKGRHFVDTGNIMVTPEYASFWVKIVS